MRGKHQGMSGSRGGAAVAALALAAVTAGTASAAADSGSPTPVPRPIGPHQAFSGLVNGVNVGAVVKVVCAGPVTTASTGHPVADQTVAVQFVPDPAPTSGFTGDSADHALVEFGAATSVSSILQLSAYGVPAKIPVGLNLPCSGTGTVAFVPAPTSASARPSLIKVTYVNVAVSSA
ncbi:hypothetical protein [Actinacidiphila sp. ITFR-21]|uniref:hypothetical protein n=1 Tax=Actinacidiphila sp. ITFR-21 TaxID=3075199 RepID=UPI00288B9140|nr:hypothetical protein [Streptomyces sp. ITFR-21]WNI14431.1 hypothetical protein RLT57_01990 [Streptomyces sp. ITFR-21]